MTQKDFEKIGQELTESLKKYGFEYEGTGYDTFLFVDKDYIHLDLNISEFYEIYYPIPNTTFRLSTGLRRFQSVYIFERNLRLFREEVARFKEDKE